MFRRPGRRIACRFLFLLVVYWLADAALMPHPELALPIRVQAAGIGRP